MINFQLLPSQTHTYQSIQVLRFMAALLVVCFHVDVLQSGYKGVDLFFVISGFVIYRSTLQLIGTGFKNGVYFFLKRLIRIFIPYWSVLLLLLCMGEYNNLVLPVLTPVQQVAAILLLPAHVSFFEVTWSLSYEVYFYFLYSLIIFFHIKKHTLKLLFVTALVTASGITSLFATAPAFKNQEISFFAGRNVWEFLLGILAAVVSYRVRYNNNICIVIFLAAFSAFFVINLAYNNSSNTITYGLLAAIGVAVITNIEDHALLKIPRLLIIAGNASYITYLIHVPVREIFFRHIAANLLNKLVYIMFVQILSIGIHLLYEKRVLKKVNNVAKRLVFSGA